MGLRNVAVMRLATMPMVFGSALTLPNFSFFLYFFRLTCYFYCLRVRVTVRL